MSLVDSLKACDWSVHLMMHYDSLVAFSVCSSELPIEKEKLCTCVMLIVFTALVY